MYVVRKNFEINLNLNGLIVFYSIIIYQEFTSRLCHTMYGQQSANYSLTQERYSIALETTFRIKKALVALVSGFF